ncbi:MAG: dihydrodipicolinate synthase family protein, partial [Planctomycetes bacterium]|nr:dihydrodipicolinate synthase family protein [Planctomycetota bacterium]
PCAGSAEFYSLEEQEIVETVAVTRRVVGEDGIVMAPIGNQIRQAVSLGHKSIEAGADVLLFMPLTGPYLSDAGANSYYSEILKAVDCPSVIYKKASIPSDSLLMQLAEDPKVVGIKYADNNIDSFQRIVRDCRGSVEWFSGSAERFAPFFMLAGATGYTSGAGNLCPHLTLAMHATATAGNWSKVLELQAIIRPIEEFRSRDGDSYNISFLKYALTRSGLDFGPPRPPQRQLTLGEKTEIDEIMIPIIKAEEDLVAATATQPA